jgi:hypothetical protein
VCAECHAVGRQGQGHPTVEKEYAAFELWRRRRAKTLKSLRQLADLKAGAPDQAKNATMPDQARKTAAQDRARKEQQVHNLYGYR